ncbi:SMI1/KNR4 family protein [Flavobacterium branchiicola]|uniref:SMI1/KNR4 family protein n=1 Tax=Flavobacterium branchiicola TaxID=1114875 RepID=A0ABV9PEF7_9FLAO|nr:SMI1/KNR4 family protein [Flavobacterium branchiicola]MBS7253886.1 SMI1/KNR4 family protein [Flavobacterium branchiicola]
METQLIKKLIEAFKSKLDILDEFMNVGATSTEIKDLETFIGQKLPESYIDLLQTYNGEKRILCFMAGFGYLEIDDVKMQWEFFKNAPDCNAEGITQINKIKNTLYSVKRVPFGHDGSGNFLCIDFDPETEGLPGQILYLPTGDPEPISVIADNFDAFLLFLTEKIESEALKLTDEREDWDEEDWEMADIYFENTWKDDWTDIAEEYERKLK